MSREIELKLELSKAAMDTLLRSDLLAGPSEDVSQRDIYFDTPDQKLRNAGFSLRIRQAGGVRTQTIKATAPGTAGLFARPEWERIVDDDHPVLDHEAPIATAPWPVFSADELAPLFIVEVQRKRWLHRENGSEIEIALDEGLVVAGDRQSPVLELELELKDGRTSDLFLAARRLEAGVGGRIGELSKSEKGYRLIASSRNAFKAEPVQLDRFQSAVDAFQLIAQSCFRQFRLNETVLLDRRNTEALHQARVSIRRLRSAFSAFKPIIDDPEAVRINSEFRWLASVLGAARNIDVLIAKAETGELQSRLNDL